MFRFLHRHFKSAAGSSLHFTARCTYEENKVFGFLITMVIPLYTPRTKLVLYKCNLAYIKQIHLNLKKFLIDVYVAFVV